MLRGAALTGAGLAGAALVGCGEESEPTPVPTEAATVVQEITTDSESEVARGGTMVVSAPEPPVLDPFRNASVNTKTAAAYVYSRLYKNQTAPNADPFDLLEEPDLADSAESSDGQHWVVKLKPGVKFHNLEPVSGREVTADDVLFSWERLTDDSSPNKTQVAEISGVEVVDDYTLSFTTRAPSPTFIELIADANLLFIQPKEAGTGFDPALQPIGSGPFLWTDHQVDVKHVLRANPDYFLQGLPYLDAIERRIIPEYANQKAQFESGDLDQLASSPEDVLDLRSRFPDAQWLRGSGLGLAWVAFSGEDLDPDAVWRDPRFRQAISMMLDRYALNELAGNTTALRAAGLDASSRWNSAQPGSFGPRFWLDPQSPEQGESARFFEYNPEEARRLLDAVGLPSEPLPYEYTNGYSAVFQRMGEAHGGYLADGGLRLDPRTSDYSSHYITQTFLGNFHGILYGIESTLTPSGYVERLFGDDPANHGRVHDPVITDLHQKQQTELDPEARTQHFYDIQRRNAEEMFYVPTEHSNPGGGAWTTYSSRVRGLRRTKGYGAGTEVMMHLWLDS
ncbi:MAG: ABC transporter substrate-binding protein [Dehalococcoidia bacterium]|nr:ABC transporter substrate-binding protein [Dehalococcoidia bacterium]